MDAEKMAREFDAWWKSIAVSSEEPEMMDDRTLAETAWNAARALSPPASAGEIEPDGPCVEDDGCPTEKAVLQRFWRAHRPDPQLCTFYDVTTTAELLAAQEEHVLKLQETVRLNVKPWEDTFPPTLLPKYLRETGLSAAEPEVKTVVVHVAAPTPPATAQGDGMDAVVMIDAEDYLHALDMLWQAHGGDNNYPLYRRFADFLPQATADAAMLTSPDSGKGGGRGA